MILIKYRYLTCNLNGLQLCHFGNWRNLAVNLFFLLFEKF